MIITELLKVNILRVDILGLKIKQMCKLDFFSFCLQNCVNRQSKQTSFLVLPFNMIFDLQQRLMAITKYALI